MKTMVSRELQDALEKVRRKFPSIVFDKYLLRTFIGKIDELKEGMPFGEALRYSLNHINVWDKETRRAYAALAGTYFGKRGGLQAARRRGKTPRARKPTAVTKTTINKKGQFRFNF